MPLLSPIRATCPVHLFLLHLITLTILGVAYRSLSSLLCSFLHSPVTLSLLVPNILLNTLYSNTISLCSSFNVSDQVSHPHPNNRQNYSSVDITFYTNKISEYARKLNQIYHTTVMLILSFYCCHISSTTNCSISVIITTVITCHCSPIFCHGQFLLH